MELALLGFLRAGPQHGYQIHQTLSNPNGLGLIWSLKQSQLYALFTKLEKDGYVTSTLQSQDPHPPRRMFELTPVGRNACNAWLGSPVNTPRHIRQEFLAKLYFARQDGTGQVRKLVALQRAACLRWLEEMRDRKSKSVAFNQLIYQYRIGQVEALLAWLETLETA